jgi:Dolichyl-phosphate-mannose-protein mannosyltransferase
MGAAISSRLFVFAILSIATVLASALILFSEIPSTTFHPDECGWISSAYYYTDLAFAGDFDRAKWDKDELGTFGSLNMHVGEWLIGIPLKADPETRSQTFFALYHYGVPFQKNIDERRIPSQRILRRARSASAFFGVLCCFLVFAIGYSAFDAWIGLIAVALLLASALFRTSATQAMTDVFYNFFLLCGCLVLVLFSKAQDRKFTFVFPVICGVLAGLACSVKITGLVVAGGVFLLALMLNDDFRALSRRWKEISLTMGLFSFIALLTVYALNPFFWPSWRDIHARGVLHEMRLMWKGGLAAGITHSHGRYPELKLLSQPLEFPRLFFRWAHQMQLQQPVSEWRHNHLLDIHMSLFSPRYNLPGEFIFIGIGLVALFRPKHFAFLPAYGRARTVPPLYLFVNYLFILLFIKLNWSRYYLPTMIAGHLIAAVGVYAVVMYSYHSLAGFGSLRPTEQTLFSLNRGSCAVETRESTAESSAQAVAEGFVR